MKQLPNKPKPPQNNVTTQNNYIQWKPNKNNQFHEHNQKNTKKRE